MYRRSIFFLYNGDIVLIYTAHFVYSPLNSYVYIYWILDFKYILLLLFYKYLLRSRFIPIITIYRPKERNKILQIHSKKTSKKYIEIKGEEG